MSLLASKPLSTVHKQHSRNQLRSPNPDIGEHEFYYYLGIVYFNNRYTIKPVLKGHLWHK